MIEFKNITKSYNDNVIFNNATFSIPLGKITCVLGASGSGKTTLLNVLAGTQNYQGRIENLPKTFGYVFQEHRLIPRMTVKENLTFFTGFDSEQKIQKSLEKVGLLGKENRYINTLSGGEKQRVSIARALLKNANLILLDEPFNSLDISLKIECSKFLKNAVYQSGKTAVMVTHDVSEALYLASKILVIKDKKVIEFNNLQDTTSVLSEIYKILGVEGNAKYIEIE